MNVLLFFMRVLEILFLIGIAGSAIVVAISFVEDLWVLLGLEKHEPKPSAGGEIRRNEEYQRADLRPTSMHSAR
jgi:hypothetical protein